MSIFAIITVFLGAGLLFFLYRLQGSGEGEASYEKKKFFFTPSERAFYDALKLAAGDKCVVFSNVRLSSLLRVSEKNNQKSLHQLNMHHVDYVLCDTINLTVLAAVCLVDKAQQNEESIKQGMFIKQALESANLPVLRFKTQKSYDVDEIEKILQSSVFAEAADTLEQEEVALIEVALTEMMQAEEPQVEVLLTPVEANEELAQDKKLCPKCSSTMVLRKADKGRRAGSYFLMCSTYPACKRAEPVAHETVEQEDWGTGEVVSLS